MRQMLLDQLPPDREVGAAICRMPDGQLSLGPVSQGTLMGVEFDLSCAPGAEVVGGWHTHPRGILEPSPQDIRAHKGLKRLCITQPQRRETRCWIP